MKIQHLLYLHGFLSDANSEKGQFVKQRMSEDLPHIKVHTITYPISLPDVSVGYIKAYIEHEMLAEDANAKWAVMGSSMGGLYAQHIAQEFEVPYIMINPALDPASVLEAFQGTHEHPKTKEAFTIDERYLSQVASYAPAVESEQDALLLLDRADEVIDYQHAAGIFQDRCKTLIFERGDHAFQHMEDAWPHVLEFLKTVR